MTSQVGDRAVVLGGSMAGLLAARVLADTYAEVVVVDRDRLTGVREPRRGVPQGPHAHGLLARGHEILEELFPGLTTELTGDGASTRDLGELRWYFNGQRLRPARTGLLAVGATRALLEAHVRDRVRAIPNVRLREQCVIAGLDRAVTRVRVVDGDEESIDADLIVDATGRGSRTPAWLADFGYPRVAEERVKIDLTYTTIYYQLRRDPFQGDQSINPVASPAHPRGAFFTLLPGNRAQLSLTGVLGDRPPTDPEGILAYARSLPVPDIYDAIQDAQPLGPAVSHRFPANVRRRYERLIAFPERLLVLGDAVCSFNPVYGQGMTVAAMEADTLRRHLREGRPQPQRFFVDVARIIDVPWDIAAGGDLAFPGVEGPRPVKVRIGNAYMARVQRAMTRDPEITTLFMRVAGLIEPPQSLMRPRVMLRVLRGSRGGANGTVPAQHRQPVANRD
jgi:2-polyprenyl-6-methoxyphenol hydroxylase-like FAD-dependent oxidoreductase